MARRSRLLLLGAVVCGLAAVTGCGGSGPGPAQPPVADREAGRQVFATTCAQCHGAEARGTAQGPALVDRIYEPSHHSDASFRLAIRQGSPEHHWSFGAMRPLAGVGDQAIIDVTAYVRQLQRAAGIE